MAPHLRCMARRSGNALRAIFWPISWCGSRTASARCCCTAGRVAARARSPRAWTRSWPVTASAAPGRRSKRSTSSRDPDWLHVAAILAAHVVERVRDLPERADLHGLEQLFEDIAATGSDRLQALQSRGRVLAMPRLEIAHRVDLGALLFLRRAEQWRGRVLVPGIAFVEEGVHADDGQTTVVFARLVVQAFFLDLAALVHGLHGAQHAAALGDGFELLVDGFFDEVGERLDGERALPGVLDLVEAQLAIDDQLDRDRAAHAL